MCTINIKDLVQNQSLPSAGEALFSIMIDKMNDQDSIILNMEGVHSLPSLFLNPSLGRFIEENGVDLLKHKIKFSHITKTQAERLNEYIQKFNK